MPATIGRIEQPRLGRRRSLDDLQVQRDRGQAAEHADPDDDRLPGPDRECPAAEQPKRNQRIVAHPALDVHERREPGHTEEVAGEGDRRRPAPQPTLLGDDEQRNEPDDQRRGAHPVDAVVAPLMVNVQGAVDDDQRDEPDRDVDVEDPAPPGDAEDALLTGEEAADDRTEHARRGEDGHEVALVTGPFARRDQVADDRQRQREQAAGTEPLKGAERGQHVHALRQATQRRADDEDRDRDHEQRLAPVDVGQLAVQRRRDRRRDQERGGDPGLGRQAVEVVADRADRGGHDHLVERGEEHAEHQAGEDREDLLVGQGTVSRGRGGGNGRHQAPPPAAGAGPGRAPHLGAVFLEVDGQPAEEGCELPAVVLRPVPQHHGHVPTAHVELLAVCPSTLVGQHEQRCAAVVRVSLAFHQAGLDDRGHLPADRRRV